MSANLPTLASYNPSDEQSSCQRTRPYARRALPVASNDGPADRYRIAGGNRLPPTVKSITQKGLK